MDLSLVPPKSVAAYKLQNGVLMSGSAVGSPIGFTSTDFSGLGGDDPPVGSDGSYGSYGGSAWASTSAASAGSAGGGTTTDGNAVGAGAGSGAGTGSGSASMAGTAFGGFDAKGNTPSSQSPSLAGLAAGALLGGRAMSSAPSSAASSPGGDSDAYATARPSYRRLAGIHSHLCDFETGNRVEVFVRVRPMNEKEASQYNQRVILRANHERGLVQFLNRVGMKAYLEDHQFDGAFDASTPQETVFLKAVKPLVSDVCNGMNAAVFAYGATGTGKTYTMQGDVSKPELVGMIPRALNAVWETMRARGGEFRISVSMVEIYNETLQDMFVPTTAKEPLRLLQDPERRGVFCQNLYEVEVKSPEQALHLLEFAERRSIQQETTENKMSSRSHRVFMLNLEFQDPVSKNNEVGRLMLVDLAGSESVADAKGDMLAGARRMETKSINQSILTLGRVIQSLVDGESRVPYRDSKLTRLVAECLGGYCRTSLIATASPARTAEEETESTLHYAQVARRIYNKPQGSKVKRLMLQLSHTHQVYQSALERERTRYQDLLGVGTQAKINKIRLMRDVLLGAHQRTEQQLTKEAKSTRRSLQGAIKEIDIHRQDAHRRRHTASSAEKRAMTAEDALRSTLRRISEDIVEAKTQMAAEDERLHSDLRASMQQSESLLEQLDSLSRLDEETERDGLEAVAGLEDAATTLADPAVSMAESHAAAMGATGRAEAAAFKDRLKELGQVAADLRSCLTTLQSRVAEDSDSRAATHQEHLRTIEEGLGSVKALVGTAFDGQRAALQETRAALADARVACAKKATDSPLLQRILQAVKDAHTEAQGRRRAETTAIQTGVEDLLPGLDVIDTAAKDAVAEASTAMNPHFTELHQLVTTFSTSAAERAQEARDIGVRAGDTVEEHVTAAQSAARAISATVKTQSTTSQDIDGDANGAWEAMGATLASHHAAALSVTQQRLDDVKDAIRKQVEASQAEMVQIRQRLSSMSPAVAKLASDLGRDIERLTEEQAAFSKSLLEPHREAKASAPTVEQVTCNVTVHRTAPYHDVISRRNPSWLDSWHEEVSHSSQLRKNRQATPRTSDSGGYVTTK